MSQQADDGSPASEPFAAIGALIRPVRNGNDYHGCCCEADEAQHRART
jgi:hypothetical protein